MSIQIRCGCGQRVQAEDKHAGKRYACPKCGRAIAVPILRLENPKALSQPILAPPVARRGPIDGFSQAERGYPSSSGIGQVILVYFMLWAILLLLSMVVVLVPNYGWLGVGALITGSVLLVVHSLHLLFAKSRVLKKGEERLLFGLLNLVAWNPTEGILILKNKTVHYVDDDLHDGGGIKLIYPVFGEEVALRVPLEPQSLVFEDTEVLTREYLPLTVRGTIKWRIISVEHFYLLVSTEVHRGSDKDPHSVTSPHIARSLSQEATGQQKRGLAEEWLRWTAEEQTRVVVSRLSTGLLVAEQIAADLPPEVRDKVGSRALNPTAFVPSADGTYRAGTDSLASRIYEDLADKVQQYGIEIHEVTLQEVRLPAAIHAQCVEACKAAYVPLIAQGQALAHKMQLRAEADVIGAENLAAKEIAGAAPAYAISDIIAEFLAKNTALRGRSAR